VETLKIILTSIGAGIIYGIIHDQITARVCIEYFTVFHPKVIESNSPTLLALTWGVIATWWAGAILGTMLAVAARAGSRPALNTSNLIRPITKLLAVMAVSALVEGIAGYTLTRLGFVSAAAWIAFNPSRDAVLMADWWAHTASYGSAFIGGSVLCVLTFCRRARSSTETQ
jgi:hypothetical protein